MVQRSVGNPLSGEGLSNFARHIDDVCKAGKQTYPSYRDTLNSMAWIVNGS